MIASREYVKDLLSKVLKLYKLELSRPKNPIGILVSGISSKATTPVSCTYTAPQDETLLCFACASSSNYSSIIHTLTVSQTGGKVLYDSGLLNPSNISKAEYGAVGYTWIVNAKKGEVITLNAETPSAGNATNTCVCIVSTEMNLKSSEISFIDYKHEANNTRTTIVDNPERNTYYINFGYAQFGTSSMGTIYEECTGGAVQITKQLNSPLPIKDGGTTVISIGTYFSVPGLTPTFTTYNAQSSGTRHNQWLFKIVL